MTNVATFFFFEKNKRMIFHENRLPADDSHEISCLICYFYKAAKFEIVVCCKLKVELYANSVQVEVSKLCLSVYVGCFDFSKQGRPS